MQEVKRWKVRKSVLSLISEHMKAIKYDYL